MKTSKNHSSLVLLALTAMIAAPLQADEAQVERGHKMFLETCAACHGENAKGGRGSDLTTGRWRWGGSDTELTLSIRRGIPGTQMPPTPVSEEEALDVVAYLRTLSQEKQEPITGRPYTGTGQQLDPGDTQPGAIAAMDPLTGDIRWRFGLHEAMPTIGVLATKGGLVFGGTYRGHFVALDADNGKLLWSRQLGSAYRSSPMSYAVGGKQYVAIAAESVLYAFALP